MPDAAAAGTFLRGARGRERLPSGGALVHDGDGDGTVAAFALCMSAGEKERGREREREEK